MTIISTRFWTLMTSYFKGLLLLLSYFSLCMIVQRDWGRASKLRVFCKYVLDFLNPNTAFKEIEVVKTVAVALNNGCLY